MSSFDKANAVESSNATDYAVAAHWLAVPAVTNRPVDIFYFYPTCWVSTNPNPEVCAIDNPSMLQRAPQHFAVQATAFEPIGNIYAPFYRQANLTAFAPSVVNGIPTTDGMAAFDHYLRHFNQGRPFIMAGHSQGANVLNNLLAQYMQTNAAVLARMIAAYVIGYPVTARYLADNPHLKFATGPGDTGCIISYNTQAPNVSPSNNPILWGLTGIVINPLTWTRTETPAGTNQGFGSYMPNSNGIPERVPPYADARIDISNGVLICGTADTNALGHLDGLAGMGVFHNFDYPFYYFNLRTNAAQRTRNFLQKTSADYDADGKADPVLFHPDSCVFGMFLSGNDYARALQTLEVHPAATGVQPIPGDFDGDGKADPAVFDPITGQLKVLFSSQAYALQTLTVGDAGCVPIPGDFDGDGKADPAVYSAAAGRMTAWLSATDYAVMSTPMGGAGWLNASADYDGDSKADPAVYNPTTGACLVLLSQTGYTPAALTTISGAGCVPVPGDFDGDGKADVTLYNAAAGYWHCLLSAQNYAAAQSVSGLGGPNMTPCAGADYDNDGKADPAVYDPTTRTFSAMLSGSNYSLMRLTW